MNHIPILVDSFLSFFEGRSIKTFVDGTLGAGGHASAILTRHPEIQTFYGIDQDETALEIAKQTLHPFVERVKLIRGNFRDLAALVPEGGVDGIFLDVGVSSMQLDQAQKGFSFSQEGPLDMRMDGRQKLTAERVVNSFSEKDLGEIFRELGEERRWRVAARAIVQARKKKPIKTTHDLSGVLSPVLRKSKKKIHPLTLVFQALRIYVNDELGALSQVIPEAFSLLAPGGRLGIISFHSLEDRIIKHTFKALAMEKKAILLTKKPLVADPKERRMNPRSRSAKMRFLEKNPS